MSHTVKLASWFLMTLLAGWGAVSLLSYRRPALFFWERIAVSYPAGLGLISGWMAVLSVFKIRFTTASILIPWLGVLLPAVLAAFKNRYAGIHSRHENMKKFSWQEWLLFAGLSFEVLYAFFRALIRPMESYDAVAIYALKAKIFYTAGCIPQDFFAAFRSIVPHIEYPLLLPLSEAWFYTFFGTLDDLLVKAAFPLYYLSILAIFYFAIRRFLSRRSAMLFTFLLASVPQFGEYATNGYADLPLAVNYSAGFFYLYLWVTERREPYMWLSLLFSVLSLWTKTEALMLSCVSLAAVVLYFLSEKKPLPKGGMIYISVLALAAASLVTLTGLSGLGVHGDFKGSFRADRLLDLKRIPMILYEYQRQFFGPKKWNMAWIVLILALVLRFRMVFSGRLKFVTMALALVFCGYAAIYMMLPGDISWHLSTTASRFFIHFLPIVFLWLALIFKEEALDA